MMDYGEVLKKAWKTIWKHKILWLFGILAGCGAVGSSGGGGSSGSAVYSGGESGSWGGPSTLSSSIQQFFADTAQFLAEIPVIVWVVIAVVIFLALVIASFLLSIALLMAGTLGISGVIKGTSLADEADADAKPLSFGEIFKSVKPHFWKVFLFNLGYRFLGFIAGMVFIVPVLLLTVCTCCMGLFLLLPIGWFIEALVIFATIAILEEGLGVFDAIKRAWQVIIGGLGHAVVMFLILFMGQLILGMVIALPIFIIPAPLMIHLFTSGFQSFGVGLIVSLLLSLVIIPFVVVLSGVLRAYVLSSWTLTYRRLIDDKRNAPVILSGVKEADETSDR